MGRSWRLSRSMYRHDPWTKNSSRRSQQNLCRELEEKSEMQCHGVELQPCCSPASSLRDPLENIAVFENLSINHSEINNQFVILGILPLSLLRSLVSLVCKSTRIPVAILSLPSAQVRTQTSVEG